MQIFGRCRNWGHPVFSPPSTTCARKWLSNTLVCVCGVVESSLMTPVGHSVEGLSCEIEPDDRGIMR
jgi:hypothetical protein